MRQDSVARTRTHSYTASMHEVRRRSGALAADALTRCAAKAVKNSATLKFTACQALRERHLTWEADQRIF